MKKVLFVCMGLLASWVTLAQSPLQTYQASVSEANLKEYLTYIASDELEGRDTGSEGQRKAAAYIINHLKSWGIQPVVESNGSKSYLQEFDLHKTDWGETYIKVGKKKLEQFVDYIPSGFPTVNTETPYKAVFVGYGIKDDSHDDYKGLDVSGKAVVFLSGSKNTEDKTWAGMQGIRKKLKLATDHGAAAVFEISTSDASEFKTMAAGRKAILKRFSRLSIDKAPAPTPGTAPVVAAFTVSQAMGADILGVKLSKLESFVKNGGKLKTKSKTVKVLSQRQEIPVPTANVMGLIEGTDKKDEVIVVSAHYDHVGIDEKGEIYNGADDDGSGTCAVLELSRVFSEAKKAGYGPRRSILFLWVTGEEKGLLGSQYFTDYHPIIPLDKIMVNLNIDMIGRVDKKHENDPNYTYIIGSDKLSSELHKISEEANRESVNLELDYEFNDPKDPNRFYYRSDHYNFAKKGIPVAFYFTGVHEDYHQPGDEVEKINFPRYTKVAKLVFTTAWKLAHIDKKIIVDSNKP